MKKAYGGHPLGIAIGITMLGLLLAGSAGAATLTVCKSGCAYPSIQDAVNASSSGDTIQVQSGTYYENVNVNKQLTLRGIGRPVVDANGIGSAITLSANRVGLEGFTAVNSSYRWDAGIHVISNYNNIRNNNASNNYDGFDLESSSNNTLNGNNASSNNYDGIDLESSSNNTLIGNNANSNNYTGIYLYFSSNNTLISNNANSNNNGIHLPYSSNNTLSGNNANSNNYTGILLYSSSNNMLISNNASNNGNDGIRVGNDGIDLSYSSDNTLNGNNANSNNYIGIYLYFSSNNTLSGNNANSNNYDGIHLSYSSNNTIYNNIFNNTDNAQLYGSSINYWNIPKQSGTNILGGSYLGGNFWAYPNGTGFSQTCTDADKDGICDAQYTLDSNNIDYLPLAKNTVGLPKTGDINGDGKLTLVDAIYLAKHVGGFSGYETIYADGDINANGNVTLVDAIYLAKHVGGFIGYEKIY